MKVRVIKRANEAGQASNVAPRNVWVAVPVSPFTLVYREGEYVAVRPRPAR